MKTCTCLIPVYNESSRLLDTLQALSQIPEIATFAIVDDGSTDDGVQRARQQFPHIKILRNQNNMGKTAAVIKGLSVINTEYVFLADADLRNLKYHEFQHGLKLILTNPQIDMLIFRRIHDSSSVYSGERVVKLTLILDSLKHYPQATGFQLEAALNQYCIDHHKRCYWFPVNAQNTYKILKLKSPLGWWYDLSTVIKIIQLVGLPNYIKQTTRWAKPLPKPLMFSE